MSQTARVGVLWVRAPLPGGVSPDRRLLGLPLARRVALAASSAGFARVLFEDVPGADLSGALAGTGAQIVPAGSEPVVSLGGSFVALPPGVIPQVAWLRGRLASAAVPEDAGETGPSPADCFEVRNAADLPGAERWLLGRLVKESEGFMSRHVERRISLALSRRLVSTSVTPNAMTLVSIAVGLAGAALFLSPRAPVEFAGSLLFLLHSILDGCDGELARLTFRESRFGGLLDFWGDNVVHSAVFGCLALGWWRRTDDPMALIAGFAAIAGTLLSAAFVYRKTMAAPRNGDGPQFTSVTAAAPSRISRMADALARRDFIYALVVLAAFSRAHWFLVLAAIGAPLFFLLLVAIEATARPLKRSLS